MERIRKRSRIYAKSISEKKEKIVTHSNGKWLIIILRKKREKKIKSYPHLIDIYCIYISGMLIAHSNWRSTMKRRNKQRSNWCSNLRKVSSQTMPLSATYNYNFFFALFIPFVFFPVDWFQCEWPQFSSAPVEMFGVGEVIVLGNDVQPTNNNNFKPNCKELEKTQNF